MKKIDLRRVEEYYRKGFFDEEEDDEGEIIIENENKIFGQNDDSCDEDEGEKTFVYLPEEYSAFTFLKSVLIMDSKELKKSILKLRSYRDRFSDISKVKRTEESEDAIRHYAMFMIEMGDIGSLSKLVDNILADGRFCGYFFTRVLVEQLKNYTWTSELVAKLCLNMLSIIQVRAYEGDDLTYYFNEYDEELSVEDINRYGGEANAEYLGFLGASFEEMPDHEIQDRYTEIIQKRLDEIDMA